MDLEVPARRPCTSSRTHVGWSRSAALHGRCWKPKPQRESRTLGWYVYSAMHAALHVECTPYPKAPLAQPTRVHRQCLRFLFGTRQWVSFDTCSCSSMGKRAGPLLRPVPGARGCRDGACVVRSSSFSPRAGCASPASSAGTSGCAPRTVDVYSRLTYARPGASAAGKHEDKAVRGGAAAAAAAPAAAAGAGSNWAALSKVRPGQRRARLVHRRASGGLPMCEPRG